MPSTFSIYYISSAHPDTELSILKSSSSSSQAWLLVSYWSFWSSDKSRCIHAKSSLRIDERLVWRQLNRPLMSDPPGCVSKSSPCLWRKHSVLKSLASSCVACMIWLRVLTASSGQNSENVESAPKSFHEKIRGCLPQDAYLCRRELRYRLLEINIFPLEDMVVESTIAQHHPLVPTWFWPFTCHIVHIVCLGDSRWRGAHVPRPLISPS